MFSLPVESARLVHVGSKTKKVSQNQRFIPSYSLKDLSRILSVSKIGKLVNLPIFRETLFTGTKLTRSFLKKRLEFKRFRRR